MTQETIERVVIDRFLDGYRAARDDWKASALYAQYLPTRDPSWRDGYAAFLQFWKGYIGRPTCH